MMLFKRSFWLTRSLFILYVHEHDRPGFGMLTMETAVIRERNVNTAYFVNQARGNTRISRTEFVYDK